MGILLAGVPLRRRCLRRALGHWRLQSVARLARDAATVVACGNYDSDFVTQFYRTARRDAPSVSLVALSSCGLCNWDWLPDNALVLVFNSHELVRQVNSIQGWRDSRLSERRTIFHRTCRGRIRWRGTLGANWNQSGKADVPLHVLVLLTVDVLIGLCYNPNRIDERGVDLDVERGFWPTNEFESCIDS